jgi:hypothetical protein
MPVSIFFPRLSFSGNPRLAGVTILAQEIKTGPAQSPLLHFALAQILQVRAASAGIRTQVLRPLCPDKRICPAIAAYPAPACAGH